MTSMIKSIASTALWPYEWNRISQNGILSHSYRTILFGSIGGETWSEAKNYPSGDAGKTKKAQVCDHPANVEVRENARSLFSRIRIKCSRHKILNVRAVHQVNRITRQTSLKALRMTYQIQPRKCRNVTSADPGGKVKQEGSVVGDCQSP